MAFLSRLRGNRCCSLSHPSPISLVSFFTQKSVIEEPSVRSISGVDESCVLHQLSLLLPIRRPSLTDKDLAEKNQPDIGVVDGFLSPEEKLRGVFIQKLRGKFAIERALTNVGVELNLDVVEKVVNRGNLGGEAIITFFNWAIEQHTIPKGIDTYHVILKALGRRKFFAFMVEMLRDMKKKGTDPNSDTLSIVMDSFVRAHQVAKAIQLFSQLEDFGWRCDADSLNVLLRCLCHRSHVGTASSLLNKMKGKVVPNGVTYNTIISGWSRYGRVDEIESVLKEMVAEGNDPDSSTYGYVLEGLGRAGHVNDAVKVFKGLQKEGQLVDTGVYNAMIFNYFSVGDFDECLRYYELMIQNKCNPSMETYVRLISAFLKARKVADAIEMFDEMLSREIIPTTGTITTFIEPLCSYGPPHAALMIYKKAKKIGCRISISAYKLLLMRLSKFGKCGMLLDLWEEMRESGYSPDVEVYEYVINGLCNVGQLENAVLVMEECLYRGFYPSKLICSKLSNKLLASNKIEMAYKLNLKIKDARCNENARRYWRAKGWHF